MNLILEHCPRSSQRPCNLGLYFTAHNISPYISAKQIKHSSIFIYKNYLIFTFCLPHNIKPPNHPLKKKQLPTIYLIIKVVTSRYRGKAKQKIFHFAKNKPAPRFVSYCIKIYFSCNCVGER